MIHPRSSIFYHESMTKKEFSWENYGNYKLVNVDGRIDAFNDRQFIEFISGLLDNQSKLLALDLKDCAFLNLNSIRFLLGLHEQLRDQSGELAFVAPMAQVQKHLDVFGGRIGLRLYRQIEDLGTKPVEHIRSEFIPDSEEQTFSLRSTDFINANQES